MTSDSLRRPHAEPAGLRAEDGRRARRPLRPALVHRCARHAQGLQHHARRARERPRRRHDLRRLGHRRLLAGSKRATSWPGPTRRPSRSCPGTPPRRRWPGSSATSSTWTARPSRAAPATCCAACSTRPGTRASRSSPRRRSSTSTSPTPTPPTRRSPLDPGRTSSSPPPTWRPTCASGPCSPSRRWASPSSTPSTRTPPASTRSTCATPTP